MSRVDSEPTAHGCSSHLPPDVATAVVEAVSAVTGEPIEHLPPLTTAIDPDTLNDLVATRGPTAAVTVSFTYDGYDVTVNANGSITVRPVV